MTDSLGTLLGQSWAFFTRHIKHFLIVALMFGAVMAAGQYTFQKSVEHSINTSMGMGDIDELEKLAERMEAGDQAAFEEMMEKIGVMEGAGMENDGMTQEEKAMMLMKDTLPKVGLFALVSMILAILGNIFYVVYALNPSLGIHGAFAKVPSLIVPMIGVWIWAFLRSFAWIPVIGVIFGIVIGPRLMMSSVILIKEGRGVTESVKLSHERSAGYWGKIVGNCIVAAVAIAFAMVIVNVVIGLVSGQFIVAALLGAIAHYLAMAYGSVFYVRLSETIMANPMTVVSKKK